MSPIPWVLRGQTFLTLSDWLEIAIEELAIANGQLQGQHDFLAVLAGAMAAPGFDLYVWPCMV